jgi:nucleoside-diphosphate-sugar epimerase
VGGADASPADARSPWSARRAPPLVNPDIARDHVDIDDVVDACLLAATRPAAEPGAVYNVGTEVQTSLRDLVAIARRVLDIAAEPAWGSMPERSWDTSVWVADSRAIRTALGWRPRYGVEDGFRRLVEWMRAEPGLCRYYEERQRAMG